MAFSPLRRAALLLALVASCRADATASDSAGDSSSSRVAKASGPPAFFLQVIHQRHSMRRYGRVCVFVNQRGAPWILPVVNSTAKLSGSLGRCLPFFIHFLPDQRYIMIEIRADGTLTGSERK
jgi:hypothetical protein